MRSYKAGLPEIILLVTGFVLLIALQVIFQRAAFFDEDDYLANVALLHQYGFSNDFLTHLAGSAGPLYPVVHFILEPLTHLQPLATRLVNTAFLAASIFIIYRTLPLIGVTGRLYALYVMAIPMTYITGGLALTEMPALFFFSAALYFLLKSNVPAIAYRSQLVNLVLAGCCMSLAIAGRQPYLLTLAALPVFLIRRHELKKTILSLVTIIFFSLVLPCYIFLVWKGLVPTIESNLYINIARAGIPYRPDFFILCIFYFAVSMLLIAPGFFYLPHSRMAIAGWIAACMAITVLNTLFNWIELVPAKSLLEKLVPGQSAQRLLGLAGGSLAISSSFYCMVCACRHLHNLHNLHYRKDLLFLISSLFLIALSCGKITTGFSSMYAAQAIPVLILTGSFFYRKLRFNTAGAVVGIAAGLLSLLSYFIND